ncbi:MAG: flavodoxin family protein [Candidatus Bathyarchaeia archaeon]
MKPCIVYFSRTGNTKRLAEAIADLAKAPLFDIASSDPSVVENYDFLFVGTPVEGFRPAKETLNFVERLPNGEGKKTVLFCTYALFKGVTFSALEKVLASKGYKCILKVSKRGMRPNKPADFLQCISEIKKALNL